MELPRDGAGPRGRLGSEPGRGAGMPPARPSYGATMGSLGKYVR
jgi:hypothetical protein